jgi:membrane protein implicated in regulation of membrane protease activity
MDIWIAALVLILATVAIAWLCYSWMQTTRASQRRVEAQNQRIIELLEKIAEDSEQRTANGK